MALGTLATIASAYYGTNGGAGTAQPLGYFNPESGGINTGTKNYAGNPNVSKTNYLYVGIACAALVVLYKKM